MSPLFCHAVCIRGPPLFESSTLVAELTKNVGEQPLNSP